MTTVTDYFGISGDVEFVDVNVHEDNRLFLDPFAIRQGLGPAEFAAAANACTQTFFDEVTSCVVSTTPTRRLHGQRLLQRFEEPRETRLGMSRQGFNGHGGAEGVGTTIWNVLTGDADALVEVGVLKQIEDMPLFVPGVGGDITSDLTTRLIFEPLADFTRNTVLRIPALGGRSGVKNFSRQVWDVPTRSWVMKVVPLPTVDGKPLLLVPKGWVRHSLTLTAGRFYETTVLSHVQIHTAVRSRTGRVLKTPKYKLRDEERYMRSYATIVRIVEAAYGNDGSNLVEDFKRWAQARYTPTTSDQMSRRIA